MQYQVSSTKTLSPQGVVQGASVLALIRTPACAGTPRRFLAAIGFVTSDIYQFESCNSKNSTIYNELLKAKKPLSNYKCFMCR